MGDYDSEEYDYLQKLVLIGDATVGKTHLLSRYIRGALPKNPSPTIGVEFSTRTVPLSTGGVVKAQIWDTAGQERYRAITSAHYRRAAGALLVYDITRSETFSHCANWLNELREMANPDIVVMLVGNKLDLVEKDHYSRQVQTEDAARWAHEQGIFFCETSATTSHNVKHCFERLVQEVYNIQAKTQLDSRDINDLSAGVRINSGNNNSGRATLGGCDGQVLGMQCN